MNAHAAEQKPLISLYILGENNNNKSVKISVQSILNQGGFLIKDGNSAIKNLNLKKTKNLDKLLQNSDILSDIIDAELIITLKLNYQRINKLSSSVYISSEIYNTQTKNYISTWSTPRKIINFPKDCNDICVNLILSEKVILLSDQLGNSILRILDAKLKEDQNYSNISKVYNFKFYDFKEKDIIYLTDIMVNEFPGFIKITNEQSFAKQNSWSYYSSADLLKLKKWVVISLSDIGLNLENDYELSVSDNNIFVKKFPSFNSMGSKGNSKKFN
tara:strand:- start:92 stop:910 length:819 start_codon:yes stop_codon:yes gene_type:complete